MQYMQKKELLLIPSTMKQNFYITYSGVTSGGQKKSAKLLKLIVSVGQIKTLTPSPLPPKNGFSFVRFILTDIDI